MEIYQGVVLGILQGLAEFLPVSSSGHLVLGQHLFGLTEPAMDFDIAVHMGTLLAVVVVFYRDIKEIVLSLIALAGNLLQGKGSDALDDPAVKMAALIVTGSIPTGFMGLFLKQYTDTLFASVPLVGAMLLVTGTFLWGTRTVSTEGHRIPGFGFRTAFFIGVCQGGAILPGISRSGATITAGLFGGIDRETAARFSFLLSIPAILGAELLSLKDTLGAGFAVDQVVLVGTLASFITGYGALILLLRIVKKGRLHLFAPYCWTIGSLALIIGLMK